MGKVCPESILMEDQSYQIVKVEPGSEDWVKFHEIQRTALFHQAVEEYNPQYNDACFHRPAKRSLLLLKWQGEAVGITTLDQFSDASAATRAVAIGEEFQGAGHGRALGLLTQEFAKALGVKTLCVNAGDHAVDFYRKLGFEKEIWDENEYDGVINPGTMIQMICRDL